MYPLNLPQYEIKISQRNGKSYIFDSLRLKYVSLTPEEWVRQHFINYLATYLGYPKGLLVNEAEIKIGEKKLRCDSVLYNKESLPRMIIEYKAPTIEITQKVIDQVAAYNSLLKAEYLVVSNGIKHFCFKVDYKKRKLLALKEIPKYSEL
ncbi:MAG: type I restriction enzyme HsdR N-terminal domain-containing protein [Prevotella sp.]|nr:type I restriction enzyme HsdR N-terminal domain-containing protein [Prevotella sp.]